MDTGRPLVTPVQACAASEHHRWAAVRAAIGADVERFLTRSADDAARGRTLRRRISALLTPGLLSLALYRISHLCHVRGWRRIAHWLAALNALVHKVDLSQASCIGPGCRLSHPVGVTFHGSAGQGLTLFALAVCQAQDGAAPMLGDRVTLGAEAVVSGGVRIGDDVQIAPRAVLQQDAPPGVIVVSRAIRAKLRTAVADAPRAG